MSAGKYRNGGKYGVRRIITWLRLYKNYTGGSCRLYRLCREHHLTIQGKRRPNGITRADYQAEKSENIIKRELYRRKTN